MAAKDRAAVNSDQSTDSPTTSHGAGGIASGNSAVFAVASNQSADLFTSAAFYKSGHVAGGMAAGNATAFVVDSNQPSDMLCGMPTDPWSMGRDGSGSVTVDDFSAVVPGKTAEPITAGYAAVGMAIDDRGIVIVDSGEAADAAFPGHGDSGIAVTDPALVHPHQPASMVPPKLPSARIFRSHAAGDVAFGDPAAINPDQPSDIVRTCYVDILQADPLDLTGFACHSEEPARAKPVCAEAGVIFDKQVGDGVPITRRTWLDIRGRWVALSRVSNGRKSRRQWATIRIRIFPYPLYAPSSQG